MLSGFSMLYTAHIRPFNNLSKNSWVATGPGGSLEGGWCNSSGMMQLL